MTTYIVIEDTPGYLPEDAEPFEAEDYAEAVAYANELADQLEDGGYECDRCEGANGYTVHCTDPSREHDLGRYISVEVADD